MNGDSAERILVGVVVVTLVVSGPVVGLDFTESADELGEGTATVGSIEAPDRQLRITDGRFGTEAKYLRVPDLVADVEEIEGRPQIVYEVIVPALDVKLRSTEVVSSSGTVRVEMADRALDSVSEGPHQGYVVVGVQSFSSDVTLANRSVEVVVT